jgi:hypothetical protein
VQHRDGSLKAFKFAAQRRRRLNCRRPKRHASAAAGWPQSYQHS